MSRMHKIFSIEGSISSGKSTMVDNICDYYKKNKHVYIVSEPLEEWLNLKDENGLNILDLFYKNIVKWSFAFQIKVLFSRIKQINKIIKKDPNAIIIMERSVLSNTEVFKKMLTEVGNINKIESELYDEFNEYYGKLYYPDFILMLESSPETCRNRINSRGRVEESSISIEYLTDLHNSHVDMFNNFNGKKVKINTENRLISDIAGEFIEKVDMAIAE